MYFFRVINFEKKGFFFGGGGKFGPQFFFFKYDLHPLKREKKGFFFFFFFCIDQDLRIWCSVHGAMGRCKVGNRGTILYVSMRSTLHHVLNLANVKLLMPIPSSTFSLIKVPWIVWIWLIKKGKFLCCPVFDLINTMQETMNSVKMILA